jgi:hypothetical protein
MVGRTLHQMSAVPAMAVHRRNEGAIGELNRSDLLRHEILGLDEIHELVEPPRQERRPLAAVNRDLS